MISNDLQQHKECNFQSVDATFHVQALCFFWVHEPSLVDCLSMKSKKLAVSNLHSFLGKLESKPRCPSFSCSLRHRF